ASNSNYGTPPPGSGGGLWVIVTSSRILSGSYHLCSPEPSKTGGGIHSEVDAAAVFRSHLIGSGQKAGKVVRTRVIALYGRDHSGRGAADSTVAGLTERKR